MKVYYNINEVQLPRDTVLTIGTFDGLHSGHKKIIERVVNIAHSNLLSSVVLTFYPHPRMILNPEDTNLKLITSIHERIDLLAQMGIEYLIITPFNRDFSNISARQYIENILVKQLGIKHVVIGYDHRFGKNREGGIDDLREAAQEYEFEVTEIPELEVQESTISSTMIRNALLSGDITLANSLLGYSFFLKGKVIKGDKIGRTIGFPTANLYIEDIYKLIPTDGVYAVSVQLDKETYQGMAYIGNRPTINGMTRNVEVNIFDFTKEIYGQNLCMKFETFIRSGEKFSSLDALKQQLERDKQNVLAYFNTRYIH